jgi:hypothetical protein
MDEMGVYATLVRQTTAPEWTRAREEEGVWILMTAEALSEAIWVAKWDTEEYSIPDPRCVDRTDATTFRGCHDPSRNRVCKQVSFETRGEKHLLSCEHH